MEKYRKKTCIEVVERTPCGGYLVQNESNSSDRWVIDKDTFESTYLPADQLQTIEEMGGVDLQDMIAAKAQFDFGMAINFAKEGYKVARSGWNGKGMWIALSGTGDGPNGGRVTEAAGFWNPHSRKFAEENGGQAEVLPTFIMKTATGQILMGWLASQTDMLAEDWTIVE